MNSVNEENSPLAPSDSSHEIPVLKAARLSRIVHSGFSGHTLFVREIDFDEVPAFENMQGYTKLYEVRNFDANGMVFMYLGKGLKR